MSPETAKSAVVLSAFWVAAIYGYRKLTEQSGSAAKPAPATSHFVIGFGFAFVLLSTIAQFAPALGGMLAVLVATSDTMINGQALFADLQKALKATTPTAATAVTARAGIPGFTG